MKNDRKRSMFKRLRATALALGLLLFCTACSSALEQPAAKIETPTNAMAGDVTISVNVTAGITANSGLEEGRIIYYMDASVPVYYAHSAISKAGTYAISEETSYTWTGVTPGEHTFSIQLVDKNNTPLPAPVVDSVTIQVGAPEGAPMLSITNLADGDSLTPGNILLVVQASNFIINKSGMGVINHTGEGHLIYYIDENPPTDSGVPATTDTSMVSTETSHLWKYITEGKHTFSAQLVNNDDTPLETPVVVTVSIDVKP